MNKIGIVLMVGCIVANLNTGHDPADLVSARAEVGRVYLDAPDIHLKVGETWTVSLPESSLVWHTVILPSEQDSIIVKEEVEGGRPTMMRGHRITIGGQHIWTIKAVKPGEVQMELTKKGEKSERILPGQPAWNSTNPKPNKTYKFIIS